jgi:cobyrinic acid a,c-diamide synthase
MQARLGGLGMQSVALPEGTLRGHTFHYAHAEIEAEPLAIALNPDQGPSSEGVYRRARMTASFMHAYFPSSPEAAAALFLP